MADLLLSAAGIAQTARDEARKSTTPGENAGAAVRRGTIITDNANGTFEVAIPGADGTASQTVNGVPLWDGAVLVFEPGRPVPWLIGSTLGGTGGGDVFVTDYLGFYEESA